MSISKRELAELVGVFSVVASLVFVGAQLYFDRQVALGSQFQSGAETYIANFRTYLESDAYLDFQAKRWEEGDRPRWWPEEMEGGAPESWTTKDIQVYLIGLRLNLVNTENEYYQYRFGLLDEAYWLKAQQELKISLNNNPIMQQMYLALARTEEYRDLVELLIEETSLN